MECIDINKKLNENLNRVLVCVRGKYGDTKVYVSNLEEIECKCKSIDLSNNSEVVTYWKLLP